MSGQVMLGLTFSDGRKYPSAIGADGTPALPGLVAFSTDAEDYMSIDSDRGTATLVDNSNTPVYFTAQGCAADAGTAGKVQRLSVPCNLLPVSPGDADVGSYNGVPISDVRVGSKFSAEVRVNTGNRALAAFNLRVQFDPSYVEPIISDITHLIGSSQGAVDLKASLSEQGDEVVAAAIIQKSKVKGGESGVKVLRLWFKALRAGDTMLSGITVQLLDNTDGDPQPIGGGAQPFVAGRVPLRITGSGRERRSLSQVAQDTATSLDRVRADRRERLFLCCMRGLLVPMGLYRGALDLETMLTLPAHVPGDANCDGKLSLEDPIRINDFIAARNGDFQTSLGKTIAQKLSVCRSEFGLSQDDVGFLDADGNTVVEGIDSTYLLDIMVQNFFFMKVGVNYASTPDCTMKVQIALSNEAGGPPRPGTRVLLDVASETYSSGLAASLAASGSSW